MDNEENNRQWQISRRRLLTMVGAAGASASDVSLVKGGGSALLEPSHLAIEVVE